MYTTTFLALPEVIPGQFVVCYFLTSETIYLGWSEMMYLVLVAELIEGHFLFLLCALLSN